MKPGFVIAIAFALVMAFSRVLWLNLDPPVTKRTTDLVDEGFWLHNARMKVLTGEFQHDHLNQALVTAPLYTVLTYVALDSFGISLAAGRLISAVAGVLIILIGFHFLWFWCRDPAWACTYAVLLSINDLFFGYNRLGLVETTLVLFVFLSFVLLAVGIRSSRRTPWFYASGLTFGLALLVKATAIYVLAAFLIVWALERVAGERVKLREALIWLAGSASAILPALLLMGALYPGELWRHAAIYWPVISGMRSGLYARAVSLAFNPFYVVQNQFVATFSVALLILILLIAGFAMIKRVRFRQFGVFERLNLAWFMGAGLSSAYAELQVDRRYWMVLVPMVVLVSKFVAGCVETNSMYSRAEFMGADAERGRMELALKGLIAFGLTYWAAPLLGHLGQHTLALVGASVRVGVIQATSLILIASIVIAAIVTNDARYGFRRVAWYLAVVPLLAFAVEWNLSLFAPMLYSRSAASLFSITAIALGLAYGLSRLYERGVRQTVLVVVVAYLVWNAAVVGQAFAVPRSSIADAAQEVDRIIRASGSSHRYYIAGRNAHQFALESEGLPLFLESHSQYREMTKGLFQYPGLEPQYFLQPTIDAHSSNARCPKHVALPAGLEGHVIGCYCRDRHRLTGGCQSEAAVVKVTRFSLHDFIGANPRESRP